MHKIASMIHTYYYLQCISVDNNGWGDKKKTPCCSIVNNVQTNGKENNKLIDLSIFLSKLIIDKTVFLG